MGTKIAATTCHFEAKYIIFDKKKKIEPNKVTREDKQFAGLRQRLCVNEGVGHSIYHVDVTNF